MIATRFKLFSGFKVPRHVRFIDEWPMSSTKIKKYQLQKQITEELGLS